MLYSVIALPLSIVFADHDNRTLVFSRVLMIGMLVSGSDAANTYAESDHSPQPSKFLALYLNWYV
jgi:hypothetical protein